VAARQQLVPDLGAAVRARPSLGLYLGALLLLPVSGLAPLGLLGRRASWTDVLVALASIAWLVEARRSRPLADIGRLRGVFVALAAFLALSGLSALLVADDRRDAARNVLLAAELVALVLLTADHGRTRLGRNAIVLVVAAGGALTVVLAVAGVALFHLGFDTRLTGAYGEQLIASGSYVRAAAGFGTPPLLANYCIVAAAIVALGSDVTPRLRRAVELGLGLVVVLTLSRAVLGFGVAVAIRAAGQRGSRRAWALAATAAFLAVGVMATLTVGRLHLDPTRPSTISFEVPDPGNRRQAFATSAETLASSPLLGTGPGSLPGENRGVPFRAHFTPLNVAATVGLPALAALATALVLLWTRRSRPTDIALWSGLAGVAIDALGQDVEHFRHVWLLIGLAAAGVGGRIEEPGEDAIVAA
jgi:hypothetical protein